jgi:hypothetical protein
MKMALNKIKDLDLRYKDENVFEWQYEGVRFRYDRRMGAVSREGDISKFHDWIKLESNNLTAAKRAVFNLINEEWL